MGKWFLDFSFWTLGYMTVQTAHCAVEPYRSVIWLLLMVNRPQQEPGIELKCRFFSFRTKSEGGHVCGKKFFFFFWISTLPLFFLHGLSTDLTCSKFSRLLPSSPNLSSHPIITTSYLPHTENTFLSTAPHSENYWTTNFCHCQLWN